MAPGDALGVATPRIRARGISEMTWRRAIRRVARPDRATNRLLLIEFRTLWRNLTAAACEYDLVCSSPICRRTCVRDTYGMYNHCNRDDSLDISRVHFALYAWLRDIDFHLTILRYFPFFARFIFRLTRLT